MTTAARGTPVRFRDLGPVEIERAGTVRAVGGARLESALALLLIHAGRAVGIDAMCEAVWGDQMVERSVSTLDSHIFRLRRLLEPDRAPGAPATTVLREAGGYRLVAEGDQVDSTRFVRLAATAAELLAAGDAGGALRHAETAVDLWRGRPYGGAADEPWAKAAVARLEEVRGRLRETHVGALLGLGAVDRALAELQTGLVEEPLRERLWSYRMTAHRDAGRRADALQAYADARSVLVDELGLEPGAELQALHADLLRDEEPAPLQPRGEPARGEPTPGGPANLTLPVARSRLIGREREVEDLLGLVGPGRLVTLVGAAGCGKTRLATEVARQASSRAPDGTWFVDLTAAAPDRVLDTVTSTLELPATGPGDPVAALLRYTASRRLLVVLDNCEHVLDATADLVDRLLVPGSTLAVLATSREPLDVDGEEVVALDPLAPPAAVELFLDRLDALVPGDGRDTESLASVRAITTAVDGLPLALELAAGRARAYTLDEIATQVRADASTLSRVGRGRGAHHHRTVRDAIDSSYRDLSGGLAALHRAAGAVPGPFTAALAAELVGGTAGEEVIDALAGLVHRSLLTPLGPARPGGASRFAQFATVRGHAKHLVERAGEDPAGRRDAWVERLVRARPRLGSLDQRGWRDALDDDLAALRATLQHTLVDAPSGVGVTLAARLGVYWGFGGAGLEGGRWLESAVLVSDAAPGLAAPVDRSMLHLVRGSSLLVQGRLAEGRTEVRAGIAVAEELGGDDVVPVCEELAVVSGPLARAGDAAMLADVATATRDLAAGSPALEVLVRHTDLVHSARTAPGPELVPSMIALHADARADGNLYTAWMGAGGAARLLVEGGRAREALPWCRAALHASVEAGLRDNAFVLEVYGAALGLAGEHAAALRVFGAVEAQHRSAGVPWPRDEAQAGLLARITAQLGEPAAGRARAEGARTGLAGFVDAAPNPPSVVRA